MRLNVITEGCGWILDRCARELEARLGDVTVDGSRDEAINYYLPYWKRTRAEGVAQIGLFTHDTARASGFIGRFDLYVCMNRQMRRYVIEQGAPMSRVEVIRPGHYMTSVGATAPARQSIRFGVSGNVYKGGRKGEHLVAQMVAHDYDVVAFGSGWPCERAPYAIDDLADFYLRRIDYLVITATDEGGPMPLVDALFFGVPVIAPRGVGWCDEFPAIRYDAGSWPSLRAVLRGLTELPTWGAWAEGHRALLEQIGGAA